MKNKIGIDMVDYPSVLVKELKDKGIIKIVELFPEYSLLISQLRKANIHKYRGIEPNYPERTKTAIKYYRSFNLNNLEAKIFNEEPLMFFERIKDTSKVAFVSYGMDSKTSKENISAIAKKLYQISKGDTINIHLETDLNKFINEGFKKEGNMLYKQNGLI